MSSPERNRVVYNRTRQTCLATNLVVADTHWSRLRGLMAKDSRQFPAGSGLWIVPCRGVHTFGMRFPIDVLYLDAKKNVVYLEKNLRPWRMAPVRFKAATVVELPPGTLAASNTAVGDAIDIQDQRNGGKA
jgi:uncharacterized membrane protein (UPF0127 family)